MTTPERVDGFPFHFRCQRSGNCCSRPDGRVRVGPDDVLRIAGHLGLGVEGFRSRYVAVSGDRLVEGVGGRCPFLEDGRTTRCTIYAARPQACRSWPFWDALRDSPEELRQARRLCPGIDPPGPTSGGDSGR